MRTFLISGAGSGIGKAAAQKLADAGWKTILLGRTESKLLETKSGLKNSSLHKILVADVCDKHALATGLQDLTDLHLTGVIANAGIGGENVYGPQDRWDEIVRVNLTGTYILVNECLPYFKPSEDRFHHIVIISSILARLGVPNYSAYCASKAGLLGLMRSWATQLSRDNILVNAICPGWVDTDMARHGIERFAETKKLSYADAHEEQMSSVPLGKMSTSHEIAELILFLVSEKQTSCTGQAFDINNGALMPA